MTEEPTNIEIKEETKNTDYIQMITNISLAISLLLIFTMKILKYLLSRKKYNLKSSILSRSNSASF